MPHADAAFLHAIDFDRARLFDTADLDEARELCGRVLNPHALRVVGPRQRLRSRMEHLPLGALSLNRLTWGAGVDVDPQRLGDYYLLSVPLRGAARFEHGARTTEVTPGCAGVVSASPRFRFTASADFEQVIVRLSREGIDAAWQALSGRAPGAPIDFLCAMPLSGPAWQAVAPVLRLLAARAEGAWDAMALRHVDARLEELLATTLLLQQPHSLAAVPAAPEAAAPRHLRHAEDLLRESLDAPWTVGALARRCGVAARTLQSAFHAAHGLGPMQWLRRERLAAVRRALLAGDDAPASISQAALAHGFTHLGEFSRAYREAYGETPSRTRARRA